MNNSDIYEETVVTAEPNKEANVLKWLAIFFGVEAVILVIIATVSICMMVYMQTEINYLENSLSEAQSRLSTMYPTDAESSIDMILQLNELM